MPTINCDSHELVNIICAFAIKYNRCSIDNPIPGVDLTLNFRINYLLTKTSKYICEAIIKNKFNKRCKKSIK